MGFAEPVATGPEQWLCEVELEFIDSAGRCESLAACWNVTFEDVAPVRSFRWGKGQKHFPGWWWSATSGDHVGFESWLERDHAMLLDYNREVVAFSSQPFWLNWPGRTGWPRHAPDYFARCSDGTGVVIDVRADDRVSQDQARVFDVTARVCAEIGWVFRRLDTVDPVVAVNLRWLSRYRHPRHGADPDVVAALISMFAEPASLLDGAKRTGDRIAVLPVLFHLL